MRKCCWADTRTSPSTTWNFHEIQLTATESRPCSSLQPPACQLPAGMWWEMWWNVSSKFQIFSDTSTETIEKPKLQVICRPCRWPLWLSALSGLRQPPRKNTKQARCVCVCWEPKGIYITILTRYWWQSRLQNVLNLKWPLPSDQKMICPQPLQIL